MRGGCYTQVGTVAYRAEASRVHRSRTDHLVADDTTSTPTVYHFPIGCIRNRIPWIVSLIVIFPVGLVECRAANLHAVGAIL